MQVALSKVISRDGRQGIRREGADGQPEVLHAINPRHNPTQDTLNRLLRPFKLRLTLAPLEHSKGTACGLIGGEMYGDADRVRAQSGG